MRSDWIKEHYSGFVFYFLFCWLVIYLFSLYYREVHHSVDIVQLALPRQGDRIEIVNKQTQD